MKQYTTEEPGDGWDDKEQTEFYGVGYKAYHSGIRLSHNPYHEAWLEWRQGWIDAAADDNPTTLEVSV